MQLFQQLVTPGIKIDLVYFAVRVIDITEDNGVTGTGLLAGSLYVTFTDGPVFHFGFQLCFLDALDA
jgi:hypothetical protein